MFGGSSIWLQDQRRQAAASPAEAREIYYRVHGEPFNTRPAPFERGQWSRLADFQSDDDHGGTRVGGRLKGLQHGLLAHRRLDQRRRCRRLSRMDGRVPQLRADRSGGAAATGAAARRRGVARDAVDQRRGTRGGLWRTRRGSRRLRAGRRAAATRAARPAAGHQQRRRSRAGAGLPGSAQRRHDQVQARHHSADGADQRLPRRV